MATTFTNPLKKSTFLDNKMLPELKDSTVKTYQTIYNRAVRHALEVRQTAEDEHITISPMDLVDDWVAEVTKKKPGTINMARSALLWTFLRDKPHGWQDAYHRLYRMRQENVRGTGPEMDEDSKRTRIPGRIIPEADLNILLNELATMNPWGPSSQWFLMARVASGARPAEWLDAQWADEEQTVLRIYNAKVKAVNAWHNIPPMTFSTIDVEDESGSVWDAWAARGVVDAPSKYEVDFERRISGIILNPQELTHLRDARWKNGVLLFRDVLIEPQYRKYVTLHLNHIKQVMSMDRTGKEFKNDQFLSQEELFSTYYYTPARHCIWRACLSVFPDKRTYSLTDTRSTFSANRKALNGLVATAAEMGHAGVTTAKDYYAPASSAWVRYKKRPSMNLVSAQGDSFNSALSRGAKEALDKLNH